MAFLPKVHNRYIPCSNKECLKKDQRFARRVHLQKLAAMRPDIDNKWGELRNGVREWKNSHYSHVTNNPKRAQLEEERLAAINLENMLLLEKVVGIAGRPNTSRSVECGGGLRLTANQGEGCPSAPRPARWRKLD